MSFFKEQVALDAENIFLNLDEFAEDLLIDGVVRKAVVDDTLAGFDTPSKGDLNDPSGLGLVENSRRLYLLDEFAPRPCPGQVMEIDGELWRVGEAANSVKIEMGILVLSLNREWN